MAEKYVRDVENTADVGPIDRADADNPWTDIY